MQQSTKAQRIEIGRVEGDVVIIGGAPQVFLKIEGTPGAEGIVKDGQTIVRWERFAGRSKLYIPSDAEVMIGEISARFVAQTAREAICTRAAINGRTGVTTQSRRSHRTW